MPKKQQPSHVEQRSTYVHPSLSVSKRSQSSSAPSKPQPPPTVNERLDQLRRMHASPPSRARRDELVAGATHRSVPPDLRRIMNIAEPVQPRPRVSIQTPAVRRGPAGPPPPKSWQTPGHVTRASTAARLNVRCKARPKRPDALPGVQVPDPGTLLHTTLKRLAKDWAWQAQYNHYYLGTLPPQLKSLLLSYVAVYGTGVSISHLRALFRNEEQVEGGTDVEELKRLDLSGSIEDSATEAECLKLSEIRRFLAPEPAETAHTSSVPAESWEEEADVLNSGSPGHCTPLSRFSNLTHLSLSHPGKFVSWSGLLQLSAHLGLITHLSLAYWPRPTVTPNSLTSSMISSTHPAGRVDLGGTNFYSEMDGDWHEAADILRRLSKSTYSLKWIDLEGCSDWLPALRWRRDAREGRPQFRKTGISRDVEDAFNASQVPEGPQWNSAWRHLEYVNVSQGWIPQDVEAVQNVESGRLAVELLHFMQESQECHPEGSVVDQDDAYQVLAERFPRNSELAKSRWAGLGQWHVTVQYDGTFRGADSNAIEARNQVRAWLRKEAEARAVEAYVRAHRAGGGGIYCVFDHGWSPVPFD